jgi:succinate--hydroxymethylglutarate CoA-transferase
MLVEINHPTAGPIKLAGIPVKYSGTKAEIRTPPPVLGEHTDEILSKMLGYDAAKRDELRAKGVI